MNELLGVVAHNCNPNMWGAKEEKLPCFQGQLGLQLLFQNKQKAMDEQNFQLHSGQYHHHYVSGVSSPDYHASQDEGTGTRLFLPFPAAHTLHRSPFQVQVSFLSTHTKANITDQPAVLLRIPITRVALKKVGAVKNTSDLNT